MLLLASGKNLEKKSVEDETRYNTPSLEATQGRSHNVHVQLSRKPSCSSKVLVLLHVSLSHAPAYLELQTLPYGIPRQAYMTSYW